MANYFIIGGDQHEYGPIPAEDVSKWIAEGRLNAQSQAKAEGDAGFRPLAAFPEFAGVLAAPPPAPGGPPPPLTPATGWLERDYHLEIGDCLSRGFELLKSHFGVVFVACLLFALIEGFIVLLGMIPFIGPLFSLANLFIAGPLLGGLYYVILQSLRHQPATAGDVFIGFRRQFVQLFLGKIVSSLLAGLCLIPFVVVMVVLVVGAVAAQQGNPTEAQLQGRMMMLLPIGLPVFLLCLIPTIYLQVRWLFTLPLIIDRQMDFWAAMKASWKMVGKHWWRVFGLVVLVILVNVVGVCACCVGVLFTAPIGYGALMYAYETIFSETTARNS
jgi:hypothetical protein